MSVMATGVYDPLESFHVNSHLRDWGLLVYNQVTKLKAINRFLGEEEREDG